ncbi:MAG: TIGR00282 family metallophosphoesterase [Deferrisomatales bacterium]
MGALRILFLGDVVGASGLEALAARLPGLVARTGAHLVIANGENVAGGVGITGEGARRMREAGVDVITTGNHVWARRELLGSIDKLPFLLRPANLPPSAPGRGWCVVEAGGASVAVVNLIGRVFMGPAECPFRTADRVLEEIGAAASVVFVDFHAEATSEKRALGWHLDGRVAAVVGTHTHVATADAQVLSKGTGYLTDAGMCGVPESVIGVGHREVLTRFLSGVPERLSVARGGVALCGALLEVDPADGRCIRIERLEVGPGDRGRGGP